MSLLLMIFVLWILLLILSMMFLKLLIFLFRMSLVSIASEYSHHLVLSLPKETQFLIEPFYLRFHPKDFLVIFCLYYFDVFLAWFDDVAYLIFNVIIWFSEDFFGFFSNQSEDLAVLVLFTWMIVWRVLVHILQCDGFIKITKIRD